MLLNKFWTSRQGNFAVITALAAIPVCGSLGMAVDYSRGLNSRSLLQLRADEAALSVARQGPGASDLSILQNIRQSLPVRSQLEDIDVNARWTSINEYTVTITGNLQLSMTQLLPGAPSEIPVSAEAVARYKDALRQYKPPQATVLDAEAGDYNRVYAYCFDKDQRSNPTTHGRTQLTATADNGGTNHTAPMPVCGAGETMSFRLYNVRNSRGAPGNWDDGRTEQYDYYTDTEMKPQETYDLGGWAILETVLCPSLEKCKPAHQGGVLPYGRHRVPQRASEACEPGKFMYYGWEDRPPGRGDSDRDYDDIRVIIECPTEITIGEASVRLIK